MQSTTDSLDDIFGSSPPRTAPETATTLNPQESELSDLPSLRRQHVTAGYRDGVTSSKNEHLQRGFDAGFPVGAQLGMRAGTVLGILEGIVRGYEGNKSAGGGVVKKMQRSANSRSTNTTVITADNGDDGNKHETENSESQRKDVREQALRVFRAAVNELSVQNVFSEMEVDPNRDRQEGKEKPEGRLKRRGDGVISRWEEKVAVSHWEEAMEALEEKDGDDGEPAGQS